MREDWQTVKLEDVCSFKGGGTPAKGNESFWGGHIPWVSPKDMKLQFISNSQDKITEKAIQNSSANLLPKDTLLVVVRSSILARTIPLAISRSPLTVNQDLKALLPNPELNVEFLYYALLADKKNLLSKVTRGATVHRLQSESLKNLEVTLPPLPEQERIVSILDKAFEGIDKAIAQTEQNLASARELFESYLNNIFTQKGEDWVEKKLGEVCDLKSGNSISKSLEKETGDIIYAKVGDMNLEGNEVSITTSRRYVDKSDIKAQQIIPKGAIVFPKRGGAIATNKKRKIILPSIVDLNTMAVIPSRSIVSDYLFYWFKTVDLSELSNGMAIPQINNYSFDSVYIPHPIDLSEQYDIVAKLWGLSTETQKLEALYTQKLNDLKELKQSLLQQAFAGELTKEDAA